MKEITFSIVKIHGELKDDGNEKKVVADISWNNREPRTEIRIIKSNGYFGNGVPLDYEERQKLRSILEKMDKDDDKGKKTPVDFKEIFESASDIALKRSKGYTTKNGMIVLVRKRK